jgi:predicted transcriptional regulator of viral defense system
MGAIVTCMAGNVGKARDGSAVDVLYGLGEPQGGYFTAQQALEAGVPRSTLSYHAQVGGPVRRIGRGVYRLRRFPSSPHEHVIPVWLGLSRADAVVSHVSALELWELTDMIADEVHVTLPRAKRGTTIPQGVRPHFSDQPLPRIDRQRTMGVPVTGVERTIADVVRSDGWTEQVDMAIHQALRRGQTTLPRLSQRLPKYRQRDLQRAVTSR